MAKTKRKGSNNLQQSSEFRWGILFIVMALILFWFLYLIVRGGKMCYSSEKFETDKIYNIFTYDGKKLWLCSDQTGKVFLSFDPKENHLNIDTWIFQPVSRVSSDIVRIQSKTTLTPNTFCLRSNERVIFPMICGSDPSYEFTVQPQKDTGLYTIYRNKTYLDNNLQFSRTTVPSEKNFWKFVPVSI